jgi:hypothetical protein
MISRVAPFSLATLVAQANSLLPIPQRRAVGSTNSFSKSALLPMTLGDANHFTATLGNCDASQRQLALFERQLTATRLKKIWAIAPYGFGPKAEL